MSEQKLQEIVLSEYGKRYLEKLEIPSFITENLSKELRAYQKEALKYYLAQRELCEDKTLQGNHLMFNMATGSGKTLIMAALMLDCYQKGYRNFIFFVNSTAILEKTKVNFCEAKSSKYLFENEILIDTKRVQINTIQNLNESKKEAINIYFTTIQGLFSVLSKERENALSFLDFTNEKMVFLADEAHHLNAYTKGKKNKNELENKQNWESIVKKAFGANKENLMLEFSATIPKEKEVQDKYKDKIIYEYALKEFCQNGYSKRIYLLKYDDYDIKARFLGGVLCSLYKELLALRQNIILKPVLLFKSESINLSKQNEKEFLEFLTSLKKEQIEAFYKNIQKNRGEILSDSLDFFKREFGQNYALKVLELLKTNFKQVYILNVNDENEAKQYQLLLNNLEDKENVVRVIFAVNKLNEGWDVLNLFDIVRLNNQTNSSKTSTISEVQLIGRGARYYPFLEKEFEAEFLNKRKFDKDLNNELAYLERLHYHSLNDVHFIANLHQEMKEQGLIEERPRQKYELKLSAYAQKMRQKYEFFYAKNCKEKRNIFHKAQITQAEIEEFTYLKIPFFSKAVQEKELDFKELNEDLAQNEHKKIAFSYQCFLKALNILNFDFNQIRAFEKVQSKREFFEKLCALEFSFDKRQEFNTQNSLEILLFILKNFKSLISRKKEDFSISAFVKSRLDLQEKAIFVGQDKGEAKIKNSNYEWLYFDKVPYDSECELRFLEFIEREKEKINAKFSEWIVVRNEGFSEFKIYDNRKDKSTYGVGFEPDFIFFGKKENEDLFALQCFIEVKGKPFAGNDANTGIDKWKEEFLESISGIKFDDKQGKFTLKALPFCVFDGNCQKENQKIKPKQEFWQKFNEFLSKS